ncbi:outer membrane protein, multidrug efflux system [Roseateles sp. YR242]|uniref:efflux transporter outer membrane subunit n=1 Tax=Roseateles sp. YR242 TaxID=1855305 RepID=UPI0008C94314|nr:efflux transporter outer membrane subunit [Roseateles sp. YR242]SEL00018.1 outer membrane protein, multidrug efflux system [Roseateles sp. YR242]
MPLPDASGRSPRGRHARPAIASRQFVSLPLPASLLSLVLGLTLAGCVNLAPDYAQPRPAVPHEGIAAAQDAAQVPWKTVFTDSRLKDTVALALANNRDLRVAALNVDKARAAFVQTDAQRWPTVTAGASASRSNAGQAVSAQLALTSFELDFFGRVRNLSASAEASLWGLDETRRSVQISLVAEVATAWLTWATDLQRQELARQTLTSQERTLALTERRHLVGAVSGLALAQAQTSVESARADVAAYPATLEQDRHALELLLGAALPEALLPRAEDAQRELSALVDLPAGVPSSVLLRRPDVRSAEQSLIATHADIGAARAARFPTISLTASAGRSSTALSDLFKSGNGSWNIGPSLSVPVFDAGASRAAVRQAEIGRDIAWATYDKTVQTAFKEVADALSVRATVGDRLAAQQTLLDATERQVQLAEVQYRAGSSTQLDVLDAQRSLYAAQQSLITLRLTEQLNRIALYKVLGGGWSEDNTPSI